MHPIKGFSKLSKEEKTIALAAQTNISVEQINAICAQYLNADEALQSLHDDFIENAISNFYLPYGVAPNFKINDKLYTIPMATEESSVVAAMSRSANYWLERGGFRTTIIGTEKVGQVHFTYKGSKDILKTFFKECEPKLWVAIEGVSQKMKSRGGGVQQINLIDKTDKLKDYYQLHCTFETQDAMGANFINTCLEILANTFRELAHDYSNFKPEQRPNIVMSILSNYVPNCKVRAEVSCPIDLLSNGKDIIDGQDFATRYHQALQIATVEPYRAVTHNKGIMNGIDAVVIATGNDFRAVEAGVHAYASQNGVYQSLSHSCIEDDIFKFWLEIPLSIGTVGGVTSLHPLAKLSLQILQQPSAKELMQIIAVAGLAQNFAALRSLVTTGIQKGHMKMHLSNILNQLNASEEEKKEILAYAKNNTIQHSDIIAMLGKMRNKNGI